MERSSRFLTAILLLGLCRAASADTLEFRPNTTIPFSLFASFFDSIGAGGRSRIASQLTFETGVDRVLSDSMRWDILRVSISGFENSPLDRGDKTGLLTSRIYTALHYYPLKQREGIGLRLSTRLGAVYGYGLSGPTSSQVGWGGLLGVQVTPEYSFGGNRLQALGLGVDALIGNPVIAYAASLLFFIQFEINTGLTSASSP